MTDDRRRQYDDDDQPLPDADIDDDIGMDADGELPVDADDIDIDDIAYLTPEPELTPEPADMPPARHDWFIIKAIYGAFNNSGLFVSRGVVSSTSIEPNIRVVIKTDRGLELARTEGRPKALPTNSRFAGAGVLQRIATGKDIDRDRLLREEAGGKEWKLCLNLIVKHKLKMELVFIEHLLGSERIIFHFKSENRVDFRGLVRDLAFRLKTRIELHQVGGRDEARLLGRSEERR